MKGLFELELGTGGGREEAAGAAREGCGTGPADLRLRNIENPIPPPGTLGEVATGSGIGEVLVLAFPVVANRREGVEGCGEGDGCRCG